MISNLVRLLLLVTALAARVDYDSTVLLELTWTQCYSGTRNRDSTWRFVDDQLKMIDKIDSSQRMIPVAIFRNNLEGTCLEQIMVFEGECPLHNFAWQLVQGDGWQDAETSYEQIKGAWSKDAVKLRGITLPSEELMQFFTSIWS